MSKASRRSSRTTRGSAARPIASGPGRGPATPGPTPDSSGAAGAGDQADPASVDAAALSRASAAKPAVGRGPGGRPPGSRPVGSRPSGATKPRRTLYQPSFFERHRTAILGGGLVAVVAVIGAFFFLSATASAYSCGSLTQPQPAGTPLPNGSPAPLGQPQPDMGNLHIAVGSNQRYSYCPPASGPHYNAQDNGPIAAKYYGPDDGTRPEGWIHNLEHGAVVILYSCKLGACTDSTLAALQAIPTGFPDSPVCGEKAGGLAPVIARFDDMATPFAALVWDRVLLLNTLDTTKILQFYATEGERTNPEPQCTAPSAGPSSAPSSAPSTEPSVAPSAAPSPSAS